MQLLLWSAGNLDTHLMVNELLAHAASSPDFLALKSGDKATLCTGPVVRPDEL